MKYYVATMQTLARRVITYNVNGFQELQRGRKNGYLCRGADPEYFKPNRFQTASLA